MSRSPFLDGPPVTFRTLTIDVQPGTNCISVPDAWPQVEYWQARAMRAEEALRRARKKKRKP